MVEIEKNSNAYDKVLKDITVVKSKINEKYETLNLLTEKLETYESAQGLENLSDEQLQSLEEMMLNRLQDIHKLKLKQGLRNRINQAQEVLRKQVPGQILKELVNFSVNI